MNVSSLINNAAALLSRAKVDSPRLCSRLLLARVLGCSQESLLVNQDHVPAFQEISLFSSLVSRRSQGEPLAYITGHKEFYGLDFVVDKNVLIPRPETELLVETAVSRYKTSQSPVFADIGTGSGILAICLASIMPGSLANASDIDMAALRVARRNASIHRVQNSIIFIQSDLGRGIKQGSLDFVVSNPPYLSEDDFAEVSCEISGFEPYHALVSPENGLFHFRILEEISWLLLKDGGMIFLEMGQDQGKHIAEIYSRWREIAVYKDLAGHDRVFAASKYD